MPFLNPNPPIRIKIILDHEKYLYLLRPYFDKLNVDVDKLTGNLKRKMLEEIIRELVLNATNSTYEIFNYQPQSTIFIIDDAQYIDKESWQYLYLLGFIFASFFKKKRNEFLHRFSSNITSYYGNKRSDIK